MPRKALNSDEQEVSLILMQFKDINNLQNNLESIIKFRMDFPNCDVQDTDDFYFFKINFKS